MIFFDPAQLAIAVLFLGAVVGVVLFTLVKVLARTWTKTVNSTKQKLKEVI
mgnify:FL=1|jgi:hypothetical protein